MQEQKNQVQESMQVIKVEDYQHEDAGMREDEPLPAEGAEADEGMVTDTSECSMGQTLQTMSESFSPGHSPLKLWASGTLKAAPDQGPIDIEDSSSDENVDAGMEVDADDAHPIHMQQLLLDMISERTQPVPMFRLRCKTPLAQAKTKLVYRDGWAPKLGHPCTSSKKKYRCMYYKHGRNIAIRQDFGLKWQIGSAELPASVSPEVGRLVGMEVINAFLQEDDSGEGRTSDLLEQFLACRAG